MKTIIHFLSHLAHFFLELQMFQTKVVEKIKTHISCSDFFLSVVYKIMWIHIVYLVRPQMTIWRIRIACWIPKATYTHTEFV